MSIFPKHSPAILYEAGLGNSSLLVSFCIMFHCWTIASPHTPRKVEHYEEYTVNGVPWRPEYSAAFEALTHNALRVQCELGQ